MEELRFLLNTAYAEGMNKGGGSGWIGFNRALDLCEIPSACIEPAINTNRNIMKLITKVWGLVLRSK